MNQKELKELIDFLIERDITEFELERGDVKVRVKRGSNAQGLPVIHHVTAVPSVVPPATPSSSPASSIAPQVAVPETATPAAVEETLHIVKSPIVGTFYESPAPGSPPFVKPGDMVQAGQVLCIIEAMKLMNEIESDVSGEMVKRLVNNNQPVEYGQPLFAIRPGK
jgi:acetyl-CoA carboxylase biotin carboxyl carrier protein